MTILYHRTAFDLLQYTPVVSQKAVSKIVSLESALGTRLPESLREWYSLKDAIGLLSIEDDLLHFEPLGIDQNARHLQQPKRMAKGTSYYWHVGDYPSGVYYSAAIAAEPDPTVECHDTDGTRVDNADEWSERSFSEFTFTCCWYRRLQSATHSISGVEPVFSSSAIGILHDLFEEGPRVMRGDAPAERLNAFTGVGLLSVNRFQLFFYNQSGLLHLKSQEDPTVSVTQVKWTLYSSDENVLSDLVTKLSDRGALHSAQ